MFSGFNLLHQRYQLLAEVLTDNGSEFAAPRTKDTHPFEPGVGDQTSVYPALGPRRWNGSRTLNDDLIEHHVRLPGGVPGRIGAIFALLQ